MSFLQPFRLRFLAWADSIALFFMALSAPLIAALIQSVCVFLSDHRVYQALIGGAYSGHPYSGGAYSIGFVLGFCVIFGIATFLALSPFRKRVLYRWLVWIAAIAVWTWLCFTIEVELK
jgi:hypothetical protein